VNLTVIFDGGSIGNGRANAQAYGSFSVDGQPPIRCKYPNLRTNNEAEMQTALESLYWLLNNYPASLCELHVTLAGDSQIAIYCLSGKWKARKPHLKPFVADFQRVASGFGSVDLVWQPRAKSVAVLGH
jgi:ribonuclease HI